MLSLHSSTLSLGTFPGVNLANIVVMRIAVGHMRLFGLLCKHIPFTKDHLNMNLISDLVWLIMIAVFRLVFAVRLIT